MAKFEYVLCLVNFLSKSTFNFQLDSGNENKSLEKHGVYTFEAEEVFFDKDILP